MIDNQTANFSWPLPNAANTLAEDVLRLIAALNGIDTAVNARPTTAAMNTAIAAAINTLIGGAPGTLDALNELAAAMGNDPNFATTMATALGGKLDKSGGTLTGLLTTAAAGLQLTAGVDPTANGALTLVSGALKYMRGGTVRELADLSSAQTMTSKTLTTPTINGGTLTGITAASSIKDSNNNNQSIGYLGIPSRAAPGAAYTLALIDAFLEIPTAFGITIPANASVAFPISTLIAIRNTSNAAIGISITTDVLRKEGTGAVGNRSLAAYGTCILRKTSATEWLIIGASAT